MDAYRSIITKRDTRAFLEKPVPEEARQRILQAGRMAGSSKNVQPCRFVRIDDPAIRTELATCGDFASWLPSAPWAVAIAIPDDGGRGEFDAGRAAQNTMVAAWAEEISSCPISIHHVECGRDVLGLPDDWRIVIVIGFGYRARPPKSVPEAARLPWDEYVRVNRW